MRQLDDQQTRLATSPGAHMRIRVDVTRGTDRLLENLTATEPRISWDIDGQRKQIAQLELIYASTHGETITPKHWTDAIAPFGSELQLSLEISLGTETTLIPVGQLPIESIPNATDATGTTIAGRTISLGSTVEIIAEDQTLRIERAGFAKERLTPPRGTTCWNEIERLTGMIVARNTPDAPTPNLEYAREQGNRLTQVQALAARLGGVIVPDAYGILTLVTDIETSPVGTINGTPLDAPYALTSDGVYNEVVGNFETDGDDRRPIIVPPAQITRGPLAVDGPYGRYTRYYASEFVKTETAARSALEKILEQVSRPKFERDFELHLDPRVEIGDTWTVNTGTGETVTGLVTTIQWTPPTMQVTLRITGDVYA